MKYERDLTADEEKILGHDLLDITVWIDGLIDGKLNNCAKRAANEYKATLKGPGATIPVDIKEAALLYFATPGYTDRKGREKLQTGNPVVIKDDAPGT